jgi:hypothetical protein
MPAIKVVAIPANTMVKPSSFIIFEPPDELVFDSLKHCVEGEDSVSTGPRQIPTAIIHLRESCEPDQQNGSMAEIL